MGISARRQQRLHRDRYRRGDADETGLLFLSDPTIRRWCGPRWRIATSRQARDLAVLTELQAANMERLVKKTVQPGPIYTDLTTADVGQLSLDAIALRAAEAPKGPLLMMMGDAAKLLGVSRATVWRLIKAGRLDRVEILPGTFRVRRTDVEGLAAGKAVAR